MTNSPSLINYFDKQYDEYSMKISDLNIPNCVFKYHPDNQSDFNCVVVLMFSPLKNATKFISKNKFITIGIYRDEGRPDTQYPYLNSVDWVRIGTNISFTTSVGYDYSVGDKIEVYNSNIQEKQILKITSVLSSIKFICSVENVGTFSGENASIKKIKNKSFYEENVVFRLLPSFKLVKVSEILQLFNQPLKTYSKIDYSDYKYGQEFDELGNPLKIVYENNGKPKIKFSIDNRYKNKKIYYSSVITEKPKLYDFYGFNINDVNREPFKSDTLISKGPNNTLIYDSVNGKQKYDKRFVNDEYGNNVIGITGDNRLIIQEYSLSLSLDKFNKPVKMSFT